MVQRPRGTRDFLPDEMEARRMIEGRMREAVRRWGYREVATPIFEDLSLFTMRSGQGIIDEMYVFQDKGGRDLALRPELTAAVLRMYVNEARVLAKPLRWCYFADCFRYERPQKGRYRQFWQFGVELIGADTAAADAEVILVADSAIRSSGLDYDLKIGHLGLMKHLLGDVSEEVRRKVMAYLDKKEFEGLRDYLETAGLAGLTDPLTRLLAAETLDEAFAVTGPLPEEGRIREMAALLDATGVRYSYNFGIARGLDYYTGMVFEGFAKNLGAESQIVGGGAYRLAQVFGGDDAPSVGFAIGFDRVMVALGAVQTRKQKIVGVVSTAEGRPFAFQAAAAFRTAGIRADLDLSDRGLGAQLARAAKEADFAVLIGEREAATRTVTIKDLATGTQTAVTIDQAVRTVIDGSR